MSDTYEQTIKELAKSLKTLNVQLFSFLLVAFGFLFTSNTLMDNDDLYWVTVGLAWIIYLWAASLIYFLTIEFSQPETKSPQELFKRMRLGNMLFGIGLVVLVGVLVHLAMYIAFNFQIEEPYSGYSMIEFIIVSIIIIFLGVLYFTEFKIPRPT